MMPYPFDVEDSVSLGCTMMDRTCLCGMYSLVEALTTVILDNEDS